MSENKSSQDAPEAAGGQLIIPVAGILFTLYYFTTIWDSPFEAQIAAFFVGVILLALSAVFLVRHYLRWCSGQITLGLKDIVGRHEVVAKRVSLLALTLGFMWFLEDLGFTLATFLFLAAGTMVLGGWRRPWLPAAFAAVCALAGYLLFIVAFDTRFPSGAFENLMDGLF